MGGISNSLLHDIVAGVIFVMIVSAWVLIHVGVFKPLDTQQIDIAATGIVSYLLGYGANRRINGDGGRK